MAKRKKRAPGNVIVEAKRSWWDAAGHRGQHSICLTALLLVALYFCGPTIFSGKTLVGGDTVQWRASAESMLEHRSNSDEEPLWATNVFSGMPGLVISPPPRVIQIDFLPRWLRLLSWPMPNVLVLLLGAYALVCFLIKDKLCGLLAACAFGLTTYLPIILVAGHNTKFVALSFAPWLLLAFVYALRHPGLMAGLLFSVALAVNLRAGHVQITYYITFLLGVWWVVEGIGAFRDGNLRLFGRATLWLGLGAAAALFMVAQIYLPTFEYKAFSIRGMASGGGAGGLGWDYAMSWSQGPAELVTLFVAEAFGGAALYWGPKPPTGGPHYVGGIVLLLATLALWRVRTRAAWALGIAAGLMVLFSLGHHFALLNRAMFEHFPMFDAFRVPETWLIAVALTLALLASLGLGYIVQPEASERAEKAKTRVIYRLAGATVLVVVILLAGKNALFSFERPGEIQQIRETVANQAQRRTDDAEVVRASDQVHQERLVAPRAEAFTRDATRTLVFLLLAASALVLFRKRIISTWAVQAAFVLLVAMDLSGVGRRYFSEDHLRPARNPASLVTTLDVDEFILDQRREVGGSGHFRVLSLESADQTRNARPSFHYESLGGYSGAKLRLYQDFLDHVLMDPATGLPNENALDMLNARFVIAKYAIPGAMEVYRGAQSGLSVLENPDPLPRAFFVGATEVIASAEETWARMQSRTFDPHTAVILPEALEHPVVAIDSSSTATARMERYGPREMAWSVETDSPRLLVISEIYYPAGWSASIDGSSVPIHRANYLLRAAHVPAGRHEVVLRFDPASYVVGDQISKISTALVYGALLILLILAWRRAVIRY